VKGDKTHPLSLAEFIIAAIEEAAPGVDGREVYMRGFRRFTEYCEQQARRAAGGPTRPPPLRRPRAAQVTWWR